MNTITFLIIVWTIIAFAWREVDITVKYAPTWYRVIEVIILAPVTVWEWIKIGVTFIVTKLNDRNR